MKKTNSLSNKRLLVEGVMNGKKAIFLLDTGASVSLIDESQKRAYKLEEGRRFNGTLVGAGGSVNAAYMCNSVAEIGGRKVGQFIFSYINDVRNSIRAETGFEILGIIGLPQMKQSHISLDLDDNLIIFE